jgi:hypothetical protein
MPETVFAVDANIVDVTGYLDDLKEDRLLALKNESDKTLRKFMLSFETYGRYKSVAIVEKMQKIINQCVRGQFFSRYVLMLINAFRHLKL